MKTIYFTFNTEIHNKLKDMKILTEKSNISKLNDLKYKYIDIDNNVVSLKCIILGYNFKETFPECINEIYENLIIKVNDRIININSDYFKSMQKKSFGIIKDEIIE